MSAKAIREATGKNLINRHLAETAAVKCRFASVGADTKFSDLVADNPWLKNEKLVVKPDQLIKRRGKLGMIGSYVLIFFWPSIFTDFYVFCDLLSVKKLSAYLLTNKLCDVPFFVPVQV